MSKEIKYKSLDIKSHKEEEDGRLTIEAYGAVFGNIDSYGDVLMKGSMIKTLKERGKRIAFCFQHEIKNAIGFINDIFEDDIGLKLSVTLSAAEENIATKIREGIYKELSIGYQTIESSQGTKDGQDVLFLNEIKLYEVSIVTVAANDLAVITSMKSEEEKASYLEKEFDSLIDYAKNDTIKYELMKLKSIALCTQPTTPTGANVTEPPKKDVDFSKLDTKIF